MALFSLKKIAALAYNRQAYLRGIALYNAGRVERIDCGDSAFYSEFITADIRGDADELYTVEIGMDGNGVPEHLYCSCDRYQPGMGACRHIVCALTDKYYRDMLGGMTTAARLHTRAPATAETARRLMTVYHARDIAALHSMSGAGDVQLTASLTLARPCPLLSLTVGRGRQYVVRDIAQFCTAVQTGETLCYGKELSFLHTPEAFTPQSRPLLHYLLGEIAAVSDGHTGVGGRTIPLTPGGVDRLLALYLDTPYTLSVGNPPRAAVIQTGDPPLTVTVQRTADGYTFVTTPAQVMMGVTALYVLLEDTLYRCTDTYRSIAADWLMAAHREREGLFVAAADMPAFCAKVLIPIQTVLPLTGDDSWRDYLPLPLQTRVYLDSPAADTVTAGVQFCYGDRMYPLFSEIRPQERRDVHREARVQVLIERYFTGYLPESGEAVFHGDDETIYAFLTEGLPVFEAETTVFASERFRRLRPLPPPEVSVGVRVSGNLLEMELDLDKWDKTELSALLTAFREHRSFTRLRTGAFVDLNDETLRGLALLTEELALTPAELKSGRITLPRYRALQLQSLLAARPAIRFSQEAAFRKLADMLRGESGKEQRIPPQLETVLRPYQKEGVRWLKTLDTAGFGGILADDMGLGKTLQIIALLLDDKTALPSLVVCPTSLVLNWVREIARFAPSLSVLAVMGDAPARAALLQTANAYRVVVTSYDLLKRDVLLYRDLHFRYQILDEAQYIKNQKTQNAKAVKAITATRRFALTGTPMENRLSELWSIFDFLMPGFLYSYTHFKNRFELPIVRDGETAPLARLSAIVSPFLLRRLKRDVLTELPEKTEQVLLADMEPEQEKVYAACAMQIKAQIGEEIAAGTFEKQKLSVLTLITRLRQICCDPALCVEGYTGDSCKRRACMELLHEACAGGHRVLLFSQFTSMLDLLEADIKKAGITYMQLRGDTPAAKRTQLVEAFNAGDAEVFLISLKAGGTGLNLTGADVVIHYDPWWNIAAEQQATDRAYRIGQENPVQVVRLVVKNTVEERILALQEQKQQLADAVLSASASPLTALSAEELLALL